MGNYEDALRASLTCPKCGATNRPGATIVEILQGFLAFCMVCSHKGSIETFRPKETT